MFKAPENVAIVEIYSLDLMDNQRGFCIDIKGHKSKEKIVSGLQVQATIPNSFQAVIGKAKWRLPTPLLKWTSMAWHPTLPKLLM